MTNHTEAPSSCCSTTAANPTTASNGRENLMASDANDEMTTCPVMIGNPVNKNAAEAVGLYRDHEGERYYFCCAGCGPAFDSDPAKYAANMA